VQLILLKKKSERNDLGSKAYCANQKIQNSKLLTQENYIKVTLDCITTGDNIWQRNVSTRRIFEKKIINNWKKDIKKNIRNYKGQRWYGTVRYGTVRYGTVRYTEN
jgi:hypothetical protein